MKVGFIGTGSIGAPMALRLLDAVDELVVFDARAEAVAPVVAKGAVAATSPRDVADRAEIVILSLPTRESFRAVALGPDGCIHGARAKIIVNTSTMGMPCVQEVAAEFDRRGMRLVDSPISGGAKGATEGTLSVMVSGAPDAIETVRPLLARWGTITVAGDAPGAAQVLKLTNNIMSIVAIVATSEALVMGAKAGLDPEVMISAINAGTGRNSATVSKFPVSVLDRSFKWGSSIAILDEGRGPRHRTGRSAGRADVGLQRRAAGLQARGLPWRRRGRCDNHRAAHRARRSLRAAEDAVMARRPPARAMSRRARGVYENWHQWRRVEHGDGCVASLAAELKRLGVTRPFLITTRSLVDTALLAKVARRAASPSSVSSPKLNRTRRGASW